MSVNFKTVSIRNKILASYGAVILLVIGLAILVSRIADTVQKLDEQVVVDAVPYTIKTSQLQRSGLALVQVVAELSSTAIAIKTGAADIDNRITAVRGRLEQSRAKLMEAITVYNSLPQSEHDEANEFVEALTSIATDLVTDSMEYEESMLRPDVTVLKILEGVEHSSADSELFGEQVVAAMRQEQLELSEAAEGLDRALAAARWSI